MEQDDYNFIIFSAHWNGR